MKTGFLNSIHAPSQTFFRPCFCCFSQSHSVLGASVVPHSVVGAVHSLSPLSRYPVSTTLTFELGSLVSRQQVSHHECCRVCCGRRARHPTTSCENVQHREAWVCLATSYLAGTNHANKSEEGPRGQEDTHRKAEQCGGSSQKARQPGPEHHSRQYSAPPTQVLSRLSSCLAQIASKFCCQPVWMESARSGPG